MGERHTPFFQDLYSGRVARGYLERFPDLPGHRTSRRLAAYLNRYRLCFDGPWIRWSPEEVARLARRNFYLRPLPPIDPAAYYDLLNAAQAFNDAYEAATKRPTTPKNQRLERATGVMEALSQALWTNESAVVRYSNWLLPEKNAAVVSTLHEAPDSPDAKYVRLFFPKNPDEDLDKFFAVLEDLLTSNAGFCQHAALRTRALARMYVEDYDGAVTDLTRGLQLCDRPERDPYLYILHNRDLGISSLRKQFHFYRAEAYLQKACRHVDAALDSVAPSVAAALPLSEQRKARHKRKKAQLAVQTYAEKALGDYMAFLSDIRYAPGVTVRDAEEFIRNVSAAIRQEESAESSEDVQYPDFPQSVCIPVSSLFGSPSPSIVPFPRTAQVWSCSPRPFAERISFMSEGVSYHPFLPDVLHAVLLCHLLLRTPEAEFRRHGNAVARCLSLTNPVLSFAAPVCPAREELIAILVALHQLDEKTQGQPDGQARADEGATMPEEPRAWLPRFWNGGQWASLCLQPGLGLFMNFRAAIRKAPDKEDEDWQQLLCYADILEAVSKHKWLASRRSFRETLQKVRARQAKSEDLSEEGGRREKVWKTPLWHLGHVAMREQTRHECDEGVKRLAKQGSERAESIMTWIMKYRGKFHGLEAVAEPEPEPEDSSVSSSAATATLVLGLRENPPETAEREV